jgi:UTP-glucose-1-phosphate uridylyltransferase
MTRQQKVRKVVIAAAGWQPRLLSLNRFERTLLPAIDEAIRAGIFDVVLIVPPNMPDLSLLRATFPVTITQIVQLEPLGLGDAVLAAKAQIGSEPFALLLPDEIDESRTALRDLIKAYDRERKPLVAVDTYESNDDIALLRYFGFARLGERVRSQLFLLQSELVEKPLSRPGNNDRRIAGRYILTPEIVRAIQDLHQVDKPVEHDLTAAINQFWRASASVLVFELRHPMLSIAPYRQIIHDMDPRPIFNETSYRRVPARRRSR